jgi:hypothetical protein
VLQRGIERGEFRRDVDVTRAVQSLVLPMVMLCLHKHSVGACAPIESLMQPLEFIRQHVELILRGLAAEPVTAAKAETAGAPSTRAAAKPARRRH